MDAVVFCATAFPVTVRHKISIHANLISPHDDKLSAKAGKLNSEVPFMPSAQMGFAGVDTPDRFLLILIISSLIQTVTVGTVVATVRPFGSRTIPPVGELHPTLKFYACKFPLST